MKLPYPQPLCGRLASAVVVCRACRPRASRSYGSGPGNAGPRQRQRRRVLLFSSGGAAAVAGAGVGAFAFADEIKRSYDAAERSGRVVSTLAICVNDYRTTLNARHKTADEDEKHRMLKDCHRRCANRTLRVLERNGGIFIKLGQHLSAMNYLLPPEWTTTFVPLQDRCPVSSLASVSAMILADTGSPVEAHFSSFSDEPIGAASLAQVHVATDRATGRRVAVKVQHPGLAEWAPLDLALTRYTFAALRWLFPEYDLSWLASEMEASLPRELDFREEAANARRTQAHFARLPAIPLVVPDVVWAEQRILVMAYEAGCRPDDVAFMDANGIDRDEVSAALARIFNEMIFGRDAGLHCDPHGGNLAIRPRRAGARPGFDVILYDHGLYRDIPVPLRRAYAKMWLAVMDGDMDRMREHARDVAGIRDDEFPLFASAITGRDYSVLAAGPPGGFLARARDGREAEHMSSALRDGLLADLVGLLGRVPRVVLLILKTNDLTRSLDEGLRTRRGPLRTFLIMARYCARTVLEEQVERIRARGSALWPANAVRLAAAWAAFWRVQLRLEVFELWVWVRRLAGGLGLGLGTGSSSRPYI